MRQKIKLALSTLAISSILVGNAFGQIYSEDFESYADGTMDPGNGKWSVDVSAANISASTDWFQVQNKLFEGRDLDGEAIWTSQSIDISGQPNVSISIDASESGTMEASDYIRFFYKLDDGVETAFTTNGDLADDFTALVASESNLNGDSLRIVVKMFNGAGSEFHRFDNVVVNSSAANQAPAIANLSHSPAIPTDAQAITVTADVTDDAVGFTASLFVDTGSGFTSSVMANAGGDSYSATIPAQSNGTIVKYYVSVTDAEAETVTEPSDAPTGFNQFQVNNSGTAAALVINEILYNDGGGTEFVELFNNTGSTVDLTLWTLSDGGQTFTISSGSVDNNDFVVLTNDTTTFKGTYPAVTNYIGDFSLFLSSSAGGETITLKDPNALTADVVDYENGTNGWPSTSTGISIELVSAASDNNVSTNWQASSNSGGNPGVATTADATAPDLTSASGSASTTIDLQFNENLDQTSAETAGNYTVNNGITVSAATLNGSDNSKVQLTVSAMTSGVTYQVTVSGVKDNFNNAIGSDSESFTFTAPSSAGDVIITEIMQNPSAVNDSDGEFFEIYNTTDGTINLDGWVVKDKDSDSHTIDNGGTLNIAAGQFLVLGLNSDSGTNGGVTVAYQYSGMNLSNSADEVMLVDNGVTIDSVGYDGGTNFPDPTGASMELKDLTSDNSVGSNWTTAVNAWTGSAGDKGSPGEQFDGFTNADVTNNVAGDGTVSFDETGEDSGIDLNFTGVTNAGDIQVQVFNSPPTNVAGIAESNISNYRWVITNSGVVFTSAEVRIKISLIINAGITNINSLVIYRRPVAGTGAFTALVTTVDGDELVGTTNTFSEFVLASNDNPLAVELSDFSVTSFNGVAQLSWKTESETENAGFEVYKSNSEDGEFTKIASYETHSELKGAGNSTQDNFYQFIDRNVDLGKVYWYQIADVEFDGTRKLHNKLSVEISNEKQVVVDRFRLRQNFPNPFNPETTISFEVPTSNSLKRVEISVVNIKGQIVRNLVSNAFSSGNHSVVWDGKDNLGKTLSSGVYFARLKTENQILSRKMLLLK
ncbi:MAG: T9SS C-terminal target domain-containing protein [Calditrichaeota bacterium]|nr:MAG: T9SS C-terminal target domain-containing protein [Calditrichota bacterium]